MAKFSYRVLDPEGKQWEGLLEAPSEARAQTLLSEHHYEIVALKEKRPALGVGLLLARFRRIRPASFNFFVRQLATLIESGIPLLRGLRILEAEMQDAALRDVIGKVAQSMEKGSSFSEALARQPHVFNGLFVAMVRAGETSGELDTVLLRLAHVLERDAQTRSKIKAALRYPFIAFSTMIVAFLIATLFIIPRFRLLFEGLGAELPLPTRILLFLSDTVTAYWYWVASFVVAAAIAMFAYVHTQSGRRLWDTVMLHLWPVNLFLRHGMFARLAGMLGMMLKSGVGLLQTVDLSSQIVINSVLSEALMRVRDGIKAGKSMADSMRREPIFPGILVQMTAAGEESGKLDELLQKIADFYDSELEIMAKNLETMIEPALILILAVFVLVLALGIFLPMWNIFSVIQTQAA